MNFSAASLPFEVHALALLVCVVWIGSQILRVPWRALAEGGLSHRWLGAMVAVAFFWSLKGTIGPGFDLHLLGASTLTLMLGFPLASVALVVGAAVATLNADADWLALPINACIGGFVPAAATQLLLRHAEPRLPPNFFIYIFVFSFLGSALGVVLAGALATALLAAFGPDPLGGLLVDYFPYYLLLGFSEAWLAGAVITVMTVWLPGWVVTFDERRYLQGK